MAEFANVRAWDPTVAEAHPLQEGEPALGSRFFVRVHWLGRDLPLTYEIARVRAAAAARAAGRERDQCLRGHGRGRAARRGLPLTYDARVNLKGAARLLDPLLGLAFRRLGDNAAAGLRRELGGG